MLRSPCRSLNSGNSGNSVCLAEACQILHENNENEPHFNDCAEEFAKDFADARTTARAAESTETRGYLRTGDLGFIRRGGKFGGCASSTDTRSDDLSQRASSTDATTTNPLPSSLDTNQTAGTLFVTGRLKDCFKIAGRAFSPEDLERVVSDFGVHFGGSSTGRHDGYAHGNGNALVAKSCLTKKGALFRNAGVVAFAMDERVATNDATCARNRSDAASEISRTRVCLVCEIRDAHGQGMTPCDASKLIDDIRMLITKTHGLLVNRNDIKLLKPGSVPMTGSGKKKRAACANRFRDGGFAEAQIKACDGAAGTGKQSGGFGEIFPGGLDRLIGMSLAKGPRETKSFMEQSVLSFVVDKFAGDATGLNANTKFLQVRVSRRPGYPAGRLPTLFGLSRCNTYCPSRLLTVYYYRNSSWRTLVKRHCTVSLCQR